MRAPLPEETTTAAREKDPSLPSQLAPTPRPHIPRARPPPPREGLKAGPQPAPAAVKSAFRKARGRTDLAQSHQCRASVAQKEPRPQPLDIALRNPRAPASPQPAMRPRRALAPDPPTCLRSSCALSTQNLAENIRSRICH